MNELQQGQIIKSKAGRDKGKLFIIVKIEEEYVYLTDGNLRRVENPKKKKVKHIQSINIVLPNIQEKIVNHEKITNAEIRKQLTLYEATLN